MSTDTVWITIGANVLIALAGIINQWLLAYYNKKREETIDAKLPKDQGSQEPDRRSRSRAFVFLTLVSGAATIGVALAYPDIERPSLHALAIAIGVSSIFFAMSLELISRGVSNLNAVVSLSGRIIDGFGSHSRGNAEVFNAQARLQEDVVSAISRIAAILATLDLPKEAKREIQAIQLALGFEQPSGESSAEHPSGK